ncbi:GNAT family N-acetyltransferase [Evansella sp. AB-rgal1]|uniref:GNAT family N-acetyltransferase n=1 Tax=Evansella sp. AB-rgal1 TaxID=3242696 RepID=UPI00359DF04C
MSFIVRKASEEDALPIQHFMVKTGVNPSSASTDWSSFLIAENDNGDFVSIVRIQEVAETIGLIRSLIVDSEKITSMFILEFLEAVVHYAEEKGFSSTYLMAANKATFLTSLGFEKVTLTDLPEELTRLEEIKEHIKKDLPIFSKK